MSAAQSDGVVTGPPTLQKKGGYPAGDKSVSQLTPPPASMTGKSKAKKSV